MPIKASATEADVKNEVKKVLKAYEPEVYWFMPPANGYGRAGIPDFVGCITGRFFAVETKRPSNAGGLTALQGKERDGIIDAYGQWFLVYDDNTLNIFKDYLFGSRIEFLASELGGK